MTFDQAVERWGPVSRQYYAVTDEVVDGLAIPTEDLKLNQEERFRRARKCWGNWPVIIRDASDLADLEGRGLL